MTELARPLPAESVAPIVISPQRFAAELRAYVGLKPNVNVIGSDIVTIAEQYPQLLPVAFITSLDRLNLILQAPTGRVVIYDPVIGLRRISDPFERDTVAYLTSENDSTKVEFGIEAVRAAGYALPMNPVVRLGPITRDIPNCGAFAAYAALVAKGAVTPTL